jgi:hypothetical protein
VSRAKLFLENAQAADTRRRGQFVFVRPRCGESQSDVNRQTNLGRCFCCETNFNPIDFTMCAHGWEFVTAVEFLKPLLPPRP